MEITKILRFEACHSVHDAYTDRCDRVRGGIHGHSYVVELTFSGGIQSDGMVLDFSLIKKYFNHITDAFDHSFIVNSEDKVLVSLIPFLSARYIIFPNNPTAENMASYFYDYIHYSIQSLLLDCKILSVTVWETVTGKATCTAVRFEVPQALLVSHAIYTDWSNDVLTLYARNKGRVLPKYPLIANMDVNIMEKDSIILTGSFTKTVNNTQV